MGNLGGAAPQRGEGGGAGGDLGGGHPEGHKVQQEGWPGGAQGRRGGPLTRNRHWGRLLPR